jgi:peptidoglycan glycosyltransferase
MNKALRRMSLAIMAMFLLLLVNINYLQVFRVSAIAAAPGNVRIFDQQFKIWRGDIVANGDATTNGSQQVIADSKLTKGGIYQRQYSDGPVYAPVTGYDSLYSLTGIELAEDSFLNGSSPKLSVYNLKGLFTGKPKQGASVYLTISPRAQVAAYTALAALGKPAAAVAINPRTGAILALASYPTFNPNDYATLDGLRLNKIDKAYRRDPNLPLLNRAINDTFPPGSTFKVVTSSTAFGTGKVQNENSTISAPTFYHLPGSTAVLTNDYNSPCGDGNPQIIYAFTISCNTAFGKLGVRLGAAALKNQADLFGFNDPNLTIPMPVSPSNYPLLADPAFTALSAIGQKDDTVTPLQEAMMAATVANRGVLMRPYLVQYIKAPDQSTVQATAPTELRQVLTQQVALEVATMMESVTHNPQGTAYATAGPGVTNINVAGKTGTAQNGPNNTNLDDAVFTCFAPYNNPQIAVGVIVKGGGFGAAAAAPIALKIIQAYLGRQ